MKRTTIMGLIITLLLAAASLVLVAEDKKVNVLLQAGTAKETVKGDLKGAIDDYAKAFKEAGSNRPLAAQALIHMAECYRKLGDAESRKIYERLVRDYADQKEAAGTARARLGAASAAVKTKGDRAVWTGFVLGPPYGFIHRVSPDGSFITYSDQQSGALMVHDFGTNDDRRLTAPNPWQPVRGSLISRDGKHVVYRQLDGGNSLRIAALPRSGFLEPREFFRTESPNYVDLLDWSPDGKLIVAVIGREGAGAQIASITVADGSVKVLKSVTTERNIPEKIYFSPDGRYIAYDSPAAGASQQRDVFALALEGGREIPAVVHSANEGVVGWSPDGTRLLFSSDRTGSVGLWALPFADGQAQGQPELIKDIGSSVPKGLTTSGALYVLKRTSNRDIAIAPVDFEVGKLLGSPVSFTQGFMGEAKNPSWSPDGKYLAYPVLNLAGRTDCGDFNGCSIAIRSVTTGQVRLLPRTFNQIASAHLAWSPDGRWLLTVATDLKGQLGVFKIDVESGEATAVTLGGYFRNGYTQWSLDGKKVYFNRPNAFIERDLVSGAEREVGRLGGLISPDGEYFFTVQPDAYSKAYSLALVPIAGGQPREFFRLAEPETIGTHSEWTPDGKAVLITKNIGARREFWRIPVTGEPPRKLDIDPNIWMEGSARPGFGDQAFVPSPDGHSLAFLMGKSASEVWAIENFLLPGKPAK